MLRSLREKLSKMAKDAGSVFDSIYEGHTFVSSINAGLSYYEELNLVVDSVLTQKRKLTVGRKHDEKAIDKSRSVFQTGKHDFQVNVDKLFLIWCSPYYCSDFKILII